MSNDRERFLAERRTGLGGSDLGVILGLCKWKTPHQLWLEKTGRVTDEADGLALRFGTFAEDFVAAEFERATGKRTQRFSRMLRHPDAPLIGHVDRLIVPPGKNRASWRDRILTDTGLEIKTANAFAAGRDSEWGQSGTDEVPAHYLTQVAAYQALTGCQYWDLAALIGNADLRIYHFTRDLDLEGTLLEEARRWWHDHIVKDMPPDPASEREARERWAVHAPGKQLEADGALVELLRELAAAKAEVKAAEDVERGIRDRLIPLLADADQIIFDGTAVASYRANRPTLKTDWRALAEELMVRFELPDPERAQLTETHTAAAPGARVLRLAKALEAA